MRLSEKKINQNIIELIGSIKFSEWTTPINDGIERKKFLSAYNKGEIYNPEYKYKKPKSLKTIKDRLIDLEKKISDKFYIDAIHSHVLDIEFLESIGNDNKQVYTHGIPSTEMVSLAKRIIPTEKGRAQKRNISAKDAKTSFLEYLKTYGLREWKVIIKRKMAVKSYVNPSKKTVYIAERNYSLHEINNLISHEIEVHAIRAHNGFSQNRLIFATGTSDYLKTEEGLAIMMEQLTGNYNAQRMKFFAARTIACDLAITRSFHEIFHTLHTRYNLSKHNSYIITKRVKRGLADTSHIGGYIKDHVYFEGFQMIKKFMEDGGDIRPLFAGKISLDELSLVKKGMLKPPKIIPRAVIAHYQYRSKQKVFL